VGGCAHVGCVRVAILHMNQAGSGG